MYSGDDGGLEFAFARIPSRLLLNLERAVG
jgi:hypothetical protein